MKILPYYLLMIIPIVGYCFVKIYNFKLKYTLLGILIGSVISPLSFGLYGTAFFLPYVGLIFLIFLPLHMFFSKPSWWILVEKFSFIDGGNISFCEHIYLALLNGIIWAMVFGFIGFFLDAKK